MMAKLYWRVKRNGKWTWTPASFEVVQVEIKPNLYTGKVVVKDLEEDE